MEMSLSEIEERAEGLARSLYTTGSRGEACLLGMQLQGLKDLALIKASKAAQDLEEAREARYSREAGPCWDRAPTLGIGVPVRCNLLAGHEGAHTDGTSTWSAD